MGPKLFPAALFTTTKDWEWPKYPPAGHSLSEWGYDMQLDNHDENKDGLEYWCHSGYQDTVLSRLSEGRTVHLVCYYLNKKSFYFFCLILWRMSPKRVRRKWLPLVTSRERNGWLGNGVQGSKTTLLFAILEGDISSFNVSFSF